MLWGASLCVVRLYTKIWDAFVWSVLHNAGIQTVSHCALQLRCYKSVGIILKHVCLQNNLGNRKLVPEFYLQNFVYKTGRIWNIYIYVFIHICVYIDLNYEFVLHFSPERFKKRFANVGQRKDAYLHVGYMTAVIWF